MSKYKHSITVSKPVQETLHSVSRAHKYVRHHAIPQIGTAVSYDYTDAIFRI